MFRLISWIIFGLIVGLLARLFTPGADPMGWILTILLGIAGSFVGGYIGQAIFSRASSKKAEAGGFIMSILGAILLLLVYRLLT
jgi:uncharacterized membrane protein YeaQ/YmgE (transglycosylase-associated protein family)